MSHMGVWRAEFKRRVGRCSHIFTAAGVKSLKHHIPALALLTTLLTGCGNYVQHAQRYKVDFDDPRTVFEHKKDNFYVRLWMDEQREIVKGSTQSIWGDTVQQVSGPYGLGINPNWYGQTDDTVDILEIIMEREGMDPMVLHARSDAPLALAFEPWLDHAVSAGTRIPLGDLLPFEPGHTVAFTVVLP